MPIARPRQYTLTSFLVAGALLTGVACTSIFNNAHPVQAQQAENQLSLTAIPPRLGEDNTLTVKPGDTTQITLRVTNSSREAMTVESLAQDFIVEDGETPIAVTEEVSNRWSLASWMVIVPNKQVVQPGQTAGVNVLITVPEDALPGGHYAMITHQPALDSGLAQDETASNQAATGVNQRVGTLVYLVVEGPINYEAFVRGFTAPEFTEYGPIPFSFTMDNRSDVHIRPQATIEIYDILNRRVENLQVESKNIFPFTSRLFEAEWPQTWGWGYYRAKLVVSFGDQGQVISDSISFWFFPIRLVIAGLIGLLSLLAAGIAVRRHILHRTGDEQKRIALLEERLRAMESDKMRKYEDDTP